MKKLSIWGIACGCVTVIVGLVVVLLSSTSMAFGADFYTEIYRSVQTIGFGLGVLIMSFGIFNICLFGYKYAETKNSSSHNNISVGKTTNSNNNDE